jgi:hypothetical protein
MRRFLHHTVRRAKKDADVSRTFRILMLEPVVGLEPTTCCLRIGGAYVHSHPRVSFTAL